MMSSAFNKTGAVVLRIAALIAVVGNVLLLSGVNAASVKKEDVWKVNEQLARRIAAEWQKTKILRRECGAVTDVLGALRDVEMYPVEVTELTDENVLKLDKAIEVLEKEKSVIIGKIDRFEPKISDALQIMREMVVDEPIESMFEALEEGNLGRITMMLQVKHEIDTLWLKTDSLITMTATLCRIRDSSKASPREDEDEFIRIIKANLGMQSEEYLNKIDQMKTGFLKRADRAKKNMMAQVDLQKVKQYLTEGNLDLAEGKCDDALVLYADGPVEDEIRAVMVKIKILKNEWLRALEMAEGLPDEKPYGGLRKLYTMQCNYNLEKYEKVLSDTSDIRMFEGADRNYAVWLIIESGLAIGTTSGLERYALLSDTKNQFAGHVLHALSRVCMVNNDDSGALGILKQGSLLKAWSKEDRYTIKEMELMTGEVQFELKNYKKSGEIFYRLLKEPDMFERALSGIVWCYIMSGQYEKAEMALKKLINQAPDHYAGAEGVLTLSRRYYQKAKENWDRWGYLEREHARVESIMRKIDERQAVDTENQRLAEINRTREAVEKLRVRLQQEKIPTEFDIRSYYETIDKLCGFIKDHYYTGTFQEISFSRSRETILKTIDSALSLMSSSDGVGKSETVVGGEHDQRLRIKKIVDDASLFSIIALIDKYRWEQDLLTHKKRVVNKLKSGSDNGEKHDTAKNEKQRMLDSLLTLEKVIKASYAQQMEPRIRALLKGNLRSEDACYLWYQLGELYYQNENSEFAVLYELYEAENERYEKARELFRKGKANELPREPVLPKLNHEKSANAYRKALVYSTETEFSGGAIYGLAWCFNDNGAFDSAYTYMDRLAREYPENLHTPQARMYCGEYFFDKGELENALASFHAVMKYPESEWFDEALYKVAWTQYRMSNPEKAISSFLALVDLGYGALGRSVLEKESMDYIAISFSEIDISGQKGLLRAATFAKKLGDKKRGCQILHRLAQVYKEQGRYEMSKKTYDHILSTYPEYEKNPAVEAEMLVVQEREVNTGISLQQKYEYFRKYNRKASWAIKQDDSTRTSADSVAMKMLYDAGIGYHQLALQGNSDSLYYRTISAYRDYISMYQISPLANECHYNLAEIQFSLGNYYEAAEEFMAVSKRYPDSKYKETAAWNAIVASQNILKREQTGK